jgi:hypothetical protein
LTFAPLRELRVPRTVPVVENVVTRVEVLRIPEKTAFGNRRGLLVPDERRPVLGGRLQAAFMDEDSGLAARRHIEAVQALFEDVERRVGGMDRHAFIDGEMAHSEVGASLEDMDLEALVPLLGELGEFHFGVGVEAKVVPAAEVDLGLAVLGPHLIALDEGQVDLALLIAQVGGPLDVDGAVDVAQPGETVGVIAFVLGQKAEGDGNDESDDQERFVSHRLSPSTLIKSNYRAIPPYPEKGGASSPQEDT